jgi:hypothetical protein
MIPRSWQEIISGLARFAIHLSILAFLHFHLSPFTVYFS